MNGNERKFVDFFLKVKEYFAKYCKNISNDDIDRFFSSEDAIDSVVMGFSNALLRIADNEDDESVIFDKEASDAGYCLFMLY